MPTSFTALSALLSFVLAFAGPSWQAPTSSLRVAQPTSGCSSTISFGDTLLCSFSTPGEINSFSFTASPNDRVIVRMGRRTAGINPHIQLLGAGGTPLCQAYGYAEAIDISACLLASGGSYTLLASNYASSATGSYALSLQRTNSPANATPLSFGQTQLASLAVAGALATYTVAANAGDKLLVRMGSTTAGLTPHLRIYQPDGTKLCENYGYSPALDIPACITPTSGQYTLVVNDYAGVDTGSYGIVAQRLNIPGNTSGLAFGQSQLATISAPGELDSYTFTAAAADTVVVHMGSASSALEPHIRVYGPDGVKLCESYSYGVAHDTGACLLPTAATYTVLINDYASADAGSYGISLQRVNNPSQAQELPFGQLHTADLTIPGQLAAYTFVANSGDAVLLRMGSAASGLYPQLRLFGPNGTLLCHAEAYSGTAELPSCLLPDAGAYTILVNEYSRSATGSYGLTLQRLNQPGGATAVLINQNASGSIDAPGKLDTYTFEGTANSPVRVRMTNTSGNFFYPSIRLYGPDGVLLCQASSYSSMAEISRCVLPSDASYSVIATNYGGGGSGSYFLSVLCLADSCGPAIQLSYVYLPLTTR